MTRHKVTLSDVPRRRISVFSRPARGGHRATSDCTPHLRCYLQNEADRCRITETAMTTPPSPIRVNAEGSGTAAKSTLRPVGLMGEKPLLFISNSRVFSPVTKNLCGSVKDLKVMLSPPAVVIPVLWPL